MGDVKNVMVIAPHPDDEVLGCGGIMKKSPGFISDCFDFVARPLRLAGTL